VGLCLLLGPVAAESLPRFAARTGQSCALCHVDPMGSGPRTRFGANVYAQQALPMALGEVEIGAMPVLDFDNGFSAAIGADLRLLYAYVEGTDDPGDTGLNSFFPMQADLYVTAQLGEYLTFVLDRGITNFETFGMLHLPERRAWLKAGHFVMPYGLRLADHTAFIREELGFSPRAAYYGLDTGIEVGWQPGPFTFALALANGKPITGTAPVQFDRDDGKAVYALAEYRFGAKNLPLRAGLSGYTNDSGRKIVIQQNGTPQLQQDDRIERRQLGVYWTATVGRFTYLGETDGVRTTRFATDEDSLQSSSEQVDGYVVFNELSFLVIQGLDLQFQFEVQEADVDDDVDEVRRIGAGFEAFPMPMFSTKFLYRRALDGDREDLDEIAAIAHFYF
jgi:hypothetical protein